jgi:hypothetical protein
LREAIVRRNHRSDPVAMTGCVEIEFARSRELVVKRIGRGVLRIGGSNGRSARVSVGIDGLAYTVAIPPDAVPAEVVARRLSSHYLVEIIEESDGSCLLVLTGFAPILR